MDSFFMCSMDSYMRVFGCGVGVGTLVGLGIGVLLHMKYK